MSEIPNSKNLKGTWNQAILTFLFPILLVLGFRWALLEPFVIPSGSMIPTLLIHDHILVKKFAYGLRIPFLNHWLFQWAQPQRGQIVVFKYPENPGVFYIKRLIGLPGDVVEVQSGRVTVNGQKLPLEALLLAGRESGFSYFHEQNGDKTYTVRFLSEEASGEAQTFKVPNGQYFFMGDNRDQSSDSRFWGFVKSEFVVGEAWFVWLSCESTLPSMALVCDPSQLRYDRFFHFLDEPQ